LSPSEIRLIENEETDKIHKLLVDDVSALQKWVDSLLEGVEALKRSQEEVQKQLTVDMRACKEDIARIKVDNRGLDSLERQIQELFRLIDKKEGSAGQREDHTRSQAILK
jgi:Holliday junction resolvasome RuvABC ATP-dependent DNA helicase subunit